MTVSNTPPKDTSEYCFQLARPPTKTSRTSENQRNNNKEQSSCMGIISSFPIIQETPKRNGKKLNGDHQQVQRPKTSELRFKMEPVGTQLEEDDDLDMCPARTRSGWPRQIIPFWKPNHPCEKPPYSYATLIAHAILSSKDGRLTLSDIYKWISEHYRHYVLGQQGWQNSIRHNLSLNKKWFLKLDRRPTQANPGKGCYWTLVAGTEQIFIDNLTQAGGHSRKHHDIGLTTELSIGHRRGSCYFGPSSVAPATDVLGSTALSHDNMLITRPEDYESPKKTPAKEPKMSPLYTTFRMNDQPDEKKRENGSLHKKRINKRRKQKRREPGSYAESEYDSGVDVSSKYVPHHKKKDAATPAALPPAQQQAHPWEQDLLDLTLDVTRPMAQLEIDSSSSTDFLSYLPDESNAAWMPWFTSAPPMFNNAVLDHTHWNVDNATWDDTALLQQLQSADDFFTPTPSTSYPTLLASRYDPADQAKEPMEAPQCAYAADMAKIEESLKELMAYQQQEQQQAVSQAIEMAKANPPVVVNLDDEEVTRQFLHFEDDAGDADDEDDEDDDKQRHLAGESSAKIGLIYPESGDDAPTSILQHHHEFVSMSELLYTSRL